MIKLNCPYKCRHCGKPYVILQGARDWSYLPVDLITGDEKYDTEFDKHKHISHLLSCKGLQEQWESVKKQINIQESNTKKHNDRY